MGKLARDAAKQTIVTLTIKNKALLSNAYMPFVKNGGLFIANSAEYSIGKDVFIMLDLMGEPEKILVAGKVIWIARKGVKSPHVPGVGIQFVAPDNIAKSKIEGYLVGMTTVTTATM